jgi:hypothetical protein
MSKESFALNTHHSYTQQELCEMCLLTQGELCMPRKDSHAMGEPLVTLSGRLPLSVLARIDAYVESMRRATPGLNIGRSDAFRILLVEGLDAVSRRADTPTSPPKEQKPPRRRKREAAPAD